MTSIPWVAGGFSSVRHAYLRRVMKTYCNWKMAFAGFSWRPASKCRWWRIPLYRKPVWIYYHRNWSNVFNLIPFLVWFSVFGGAIAKLIGMSCKEEQEVHMYLRGRVTRQISLINSNIHSFLWTHVCSRKPSPCLSSHAARNKPPPLFVNRYLYCLLNAIRATGCLWTVFNDPHWPEFHKLPSSDPQPG